MAINFEITPPDVHIEEFKYPKCTPVIPTVFDETLSVYELLCKIIKKLDDILNGESAVDKELKYIIEELIDVINRGDLC